MQGDANSSSPLWLPKKDKNGNVLKKRLADAALRNWRRMRDYAARRRVDLSFAADIVESIVKTMSTGRARTPTTAIRKPDSYIVARFTRQIKRFLVRERRIKYVPTLAELESLRASQDWEWPLRLENLIQAKEALACMDADTRRTCWRRAQGYSWKEIAQRQGVRVNTAIKAYQRGLQKARERMGLVGGPKDDC